MSKKINKSKNTIEEVDDEIMKSQTFKMNTGRLIKMEKYKQALLRDERMFLQ